MKKSSAVKSADTETDMSAISVGKKCTKNSMKGRKNKMARQVSETQNRIKVIEKLIAMDITTEEKVKDLTPNDLANSDFSFNDLAVIHNLQKAIKNNTVYSFLVGKSEV